MVQPYLNRVQATKDKTSKKRREMELNELALMQMDWSTDVKLACYELQQIRPISDSETIKETAQVLEEMLQAVCGQSQGYKYTNPAAYLGKN